MKRWTVCFLAAAMSAAMAFTSFAGWEWHDDDGDGEEGCYYFREDGSLLRNGVTPDNYQVNQDGLWTVRGVVQTRAGKTYDMTNVIQEIRTLYADTNNSLNQLRKVKGYSDQYNYYVNADETAYYGADGVIRKRVIPEKKMEVYYYSPSCSAYVKDGEDYDNLAFVFATGEDGKEYRIYFRDWKIIRYIGPDHQTVDFPGGASFVNFCTKSSSLNGGDALWGLLAGADPGWWISYEGEDNDHATMTE